MKLWPLNPPTLKMFFVVFFFFFPTVRELFGLAFFSLFFFSKVTSWFTRSFKTWCEVRWGEKIKHGLVLFLAIAVCFWSSRGLVDYTLLLRFKRPACILSTCFIKKKKNTWKYLVFGKLSKFKRKLLKFIWRWLFRFGSRCQGVNNSWAECINGLGLVFDAFGLAFGSS